MNFIILIMFIIEIIMYCCGCKDSLILQIA